MKWFNVFQDKNHDGDLSATELTSRAELAFKVSTHPIHKCSLTKSMLSICLTFGNLEFYHILNKQNPLPILQRLHLYRIWTKTTTGFWQKGSSPNCCSIWQRSRFWLSWQSHVKLYIVLGTGYRIWRFKYDIIYDVWHSLIASKENKYNLPYYHDTTQPKQIWFTIITIIPHNPGGCRDGKVWRGWRREVGLSGLFHLNFFISMKYLG